MNERERKINLVTNPALARSAAEVQRAHDLIACYLEGFIKGHAFDKEAMGNLAVAQNVLCWLLGHAEEPFGKGLRELHALAHQLGYGLVDMSSKLENN